MGMRKINLNTIGTRLLIGFASMSLIIVIILFLNIGLTGNLLDRNQEMTNTYRPAYNLLKTLDGEVDRTGYSLSVYMQTKNDTFKVSRNMIWDAYIIPTLDSLATFEAIFADPALQSTLNSATVIGQQLRLRQDEVEALSERATGTLKINLDDYNGVVNDTLTLGTDLQTWIDNKLGTFSTATAQSEDMKVLEAELGAGTKIEGFARFEIGG